MRKKSITLFAAMFAAMYTMAAVTITTSAKTFDKDGGAASVVVQGSGTWTATSDSSWIVIKQGTSGSGAGSCVYIVNANATADTRIGHLTIGGNTYTITQYGYTATISPSSASFDRNGGSGTISVTVDAGISWTAKSNNDWISVTPQSGTSVGVVSYSVNSYDGVVSRVGSITIGGKTFTVNQTGADVSLSPEQVSKGEDADIIAVTVTALATTKWTVVPNASWISVVDKATGYGDYVLTLAINANPSFERRTGTVSIGSAIFTIVQEGTETASLSITPEKAEAAASGAYGNVAVYATPDATWTAESTEPWLSISEGKSGAGNGNIKYIASANPTLSTRTGQIIVTPPHKVIEPDLYRGLLFWIKDQKNIEGNELRQTTLPLSTVLDGSKAIKFSGYGIPRSETSAFSFALSFKVGELNCINRLFQLGRTPRHFYLDEENILHFDRSTYLRTVDWKATKANTWYTIVVSHDAGVNTSGKFTIYIGEKDGKLEKVYSNSEGAFFNCNNLDGLGYSFVLGQTDSPSSGYLTSGQFANIRFWMRTLSDEECEMVDVNQSMAMTEDDIPLGAPSGVKWDFYPLDGNAYRTKNTSMAALAQNTILTNWTDSADRYGAKRSAVTSTGDGRVTITGFETLFDGSYTLNNGKSLTYNSGDYSYSYNHNYYPFPVTSKSGSEIDATYALWVKIDALPSTGNAELLSRTVSVYTDSYGTEVSPQVINKSLKLCVSNVGKLVLSGSGITTTTFPKVVTPEVWHHIALIGKATSSIQVFLDGSEIGNIPSSMTLGYLPPVDRRFQYRANNIYVKGSIDDCNATFILGGWDGAADGLTFFHSALTSAQVRELYEKQRVQYVVHTVTQGIQSAQLNKNKVTVPAEGYSGAVSLTLAQSVQWTAVENSDWIHVIGDTEGAGSADISFVVDANPAVTARTGSFTVAGKKVTVVQNGLRASVECEDTSFGVESDSGILWVETEGGGTWTASTDVDWIHLFEESGTGSTPVMFVVDDYTTTTQSRTGTITIAGKKVVITQQGYELSIDPKVADVGSNAGAGQFGVAAPIDAVWEAIADCDWITIIGARTGIGDGIIQYTIADNLTGETRTGRIVVGGKTYTITQRTTLPLTTRTVGSGSVTGAGNYNQGTQVILKAIPAQGYEFSHWSGDAVGVTDSVKIDMDTAKNVTATFIPEAAAQVLAEKKAAQGGFYTRDQIHALEVGNLVLDVDSASGTARVGVQLMETSDLSDPNSWKPVNMTQGNLDVGNDGTVGLNVKATGNAKFFKVVVPEK